jgi:hypothetical protein
MAKDIYFGRDTRMFLVQGSSTWEIPMLNGFSFTQGSNVSEVTLSEMTDATGVSRRGRVAFTDSQSPAEWSFDTYIRPTIANATHTAVEAPLWANFVANNVLTAGAWVTDTVTRAASAMDVSFSKSNRSELGKFDLVFVVGGNSTATNFDPAVAPGSPVAGTAYDVKMYRLYDATINEVSITFDIDGIAMMGWSGNASILRDYETPFSTLSAIVEGLTQTNNFIRNRLTQLTAVRTLPAGGTKAYNITLTGGSLTFSNNLSYLTPELLGRVNVPIGHVTGTRAIGGSFTCYMDATANGSSDLFKDLAEDQTSIRNKFDLTFYVGGASGTADVPRGPGVAFGFPNAHITIPTLDTGDVIALSVDFTALPSSLSLADEVDLIKYVGVAP